MEVHFIIASKYSHTSWSLAFDTLYNYNLTFMIQQTFNQSVQVQEAALVWNGPFWDVSCLHLRDPSSSPNSSTFVLLPLVPDESWGKRQRESHQQWRDPLQQEAAYLRHIHDHTIFSYTPPTIAVSCLCSTARLPTLSKGTCTAKLTSRAVALSKSIDIEAKMEWRVSVSYKVI